jgi:predicted metal-dependent peptidase
MTKIKNSCSIDKTERERKEVILKMQIILNNLLRDAEALSIALATATDDEFISQATYDDVLYSLASELEDALYTLTQNN